MATSSRTPRIFISHNRKDNDFGIRLVEDLRQAIGNESAVWYDSRGGLNGGDIWWKIIKKELRRRNTFIVIFSPNSLKSPWVEKEIDIAWKYHVHGKMKIIPILYHLCKIPEDLQTIQIISFLDKSYEEAFQELKVALKISKSSINIGIINQSSNYQVDKVRQLVQEVEMAYHKGDWSYVIEKVDIIANQYPEVMPLSLYCMQGWAYYFEGQSHLAQAALEKGIKEVKDPQKQLRFLDLYIAQFISDGQWDRSLPWIKEALQLDPHNPTWQVAQVDALKKTHQNSHIIPEQAALHPSGSRNPTEVPLRNTATETSENVMQFALDRKQNVHIDNGYLTESMSNNKSKDTEVQMRQLVLQKEQFKLQKEIMVFAIEMWERVASAYPDADSDTKAMLLRAFLPKFSPFENEQES